MTISILFIRPIIYITMLLHLLTLTADAEIISNIKHNDIKIKNINTHYKYSGNSENDGIIFIHGTPGSSQAFSDYLNDKKLQKSYFMVSIDRPGWGKSQITDKKHLGDFNIQANSISQIFELYPEKKWVIVGHSLGASISPKIFLNSHTKLNGGILLAGSINPILGKPRWFNRFANTWLINKFVSTDLKKANKEIMVLHEELKKLTNEITKVKLDIPLIVIQGQKDKLVSPKNPEYIRNTWNESFRSIEIIMLPKAGHFLPWENKNTIINAIEKINSN